MSVSPSASWTTPFMCIVLVVPEFGVMVPLEKSSIWPYVVVDIKTLSIVGALFSSAEALCGLLFESRSASDMQMITRLVRVIEVM